MNRPDEGRRTLVMGAMRSALGPVGVAALAERLAVHPNTVRFHLDALEREGLVVRAERRGSGRGRPTVLYRPVTRDDQSVRRYELLADVLITALDEDPAARERAARAGQERGRRHAQRSPAGAADPVERLLGYLDEAGFAPVRASADVVELHNCPFGELAERGGRVACAVHAGMMRGALAGWSADVSIEDLEPFVRPGVCRTRLAGATSGEDQG
ncbi:MAG TPA: helix-turn-helix domain-containing protein [Microbacteriaceae bacterium]|nr:helix-turn-helix domain-containing protein [Microbacteriaceae bacterium]